MDKIAIIGSLNLNHKAFIAYIYDLSSKDFDYSIGEKWTAGQQMQHIVLSLSSLSKVFQMPKEMLEAKFGRLERPSKSYDEIVAIYLSFLSQGYKAPPHYLPAVISYKSKSELISNLSQVVEDLCIKINSFNEEELDSFCIHHPSLGKVSLREMLYHAIYHVAHHQELTKKNLNEI